MTTPAQQPTGLATAATDASFDSASWLGRTIDERYRVEQLLGQGGMGAVFLAEHVKLQKKVALKVILPQFAGNGEVAERFAREAMASAKLEHPHVASALDYGTLPEGGAYLVMQLARGPSLRKALENKAEGRRGWPYACEIGAQVADALAAAHAASIVHRDLKPENVMLEPRDDGGELVKVLDFGIARVIDDAAAPGGGSKLTRVGTIIGTPGYMSPEQALGEPVDARADVYALGVILWEICCGRELFEETEVTALVTKQLTTEAPRIAALVPDVPPELDALVARMLAREKSARPERAGEVRDVLKRLAFAATAQRMSLPAGVSGSFPVSATGAHPAAAPVRPSLLSALPPQLAELGASLGPRLARPPLVYGLVGAAGLLALLVLVTFVMICSGGSEPDAPIVTAPNLSPPPSTAPVPRTGPGPVPRGVEPPPTSLVATAGAGAPIPEAFAADFATLVGESGRAARRDAAARVLAEPEAAVPPVVRLVARLDHESGCETRRDIVVALGQLGDARALPPLERIDRNHRGCGFFRSQDCYRCLRSELADTLTRLRAAGP